MINRHFVEDVRDELTVLEDLLTPKKYANDVQTENICILR